MVHFQSKEHGDDGAFHHKYGQGQIFSHSSHFNHQPKAARKLLLRKQELRKLHRAVQASGNTIVPLNLFINERGLAKLKIALAKGKKSYDKRETIKTRESKRQLDRIKKQFNN